MQNSALLQDGYVVDVPYPTFVHRQAMPVWLNMLCQLQGVQGADLQRPYRYLELGCAMGIHLHLTAAANPQGHFVGVDFNPQQLLVAEEGLAYSQIDNLQFIQAGFSDLLSYDLEPFDFIVTHGVWSWISPQQQDAMTQVIERLLKPNGILYCSYMSHPGATGLSSIQKLMFEMSRNLTGDSAQKAMQGLHLARRIGQHKVGLFEHIPQLNQQLAELAQDRPNYVAHDFLAEHWQPQHSADMLRRFGDLGLSYCGGAGLLENLPMLSLTPEIRKIVDSLPLVTLQETVKDIARHTLQRQDVYVREAKKLSPAQQQEWDQNCYFTLLPEAPVGKNLAQDTKLGHIHDAVTFFAAILNYLKSQACSVSELLQHFAGQINHAQLCDLLAVLVWAGYIHPQNPQPDAPFAALTNQWMQQQNLPWRCLPHCGTAIEVHSA